MNLNETSGAALEANKMPLQLLQHERRAIKSETVSSDNKLESLEPVESDENILIKQELLHDELDIKIEDEEKILDDTHYQGNQPSKLKKLFKCDICGYCTSNKSNLNVHLRTHTREKPFKCNWCDYSSSTSSNLQKHLRTHPGEKRFKCSLCNYSCTQNSALKSHVRTHTGEKSFMCNVCNHAFLQKIHLKWHMISHNRKKPC